MFSTCLHNMVNFGPLAAEIDPVGKNSACMSALAERRYETGCKKSKYAVISDPEVVRRMPKVVRIPRSICVAM